MKYEPIFQYLIANPNTTLTFATTGDLITARRAMQSGLNRVRTQVNAIRHMHNQPAINNVFCVHVADGAVHVTILPSKQIEFELVAVSPSPLPSDTTID